MCNIHPYCTITRNRAVNKAVQGITLAINKASLIINLSFEKRFEAIVRGRQETLLDFKTSRIEDVSDRRPFANSHSDFLHHVLDPERSAQRDGTFRRHRLNNKTVRQSKVIRSSVSTTPWMTPLSLSDCAAIIARTAGANERKYWRGIKIADCPAVRASGIKLVEIRCICDLPAFGNLCSIFKHLLDVGLLLEERSSFLF